MSHKRSMYHQFLWVIGIFFILFIGIGSWSLYRLEHEVQHQVTHTLKNEMMMTIAMLNNDMDKFNMLSPIVRSRQPELVELIYNDNHAAISIVLQDLAAFFNIDLLLFFTEDGTLVSNRQDLNTGTTLDFINEIPLDQLTEETHLIQIPDSLKHLVKNGSPETLISYANSLYLEDFNGDEAGHIAMFKFLTGHKAKHLVSHLAMHTEIIMTTMEGEKILSSLEGEWHWLDDAGTQIQAGGKEYYVTSHPLSDLNGKEMLKLITALDKAPFQAMTQRLLANNLAIYLGLLVAVVFLVYFMKRRIFNRVYAQVMALRQVSLGNLNTRLKLPNNLPPEKHDEIMGMGADFNQMMDRLERSYEELEENTLQLEQAGRDMAEAKEAAEAANRAKSEFLANISHELRTPMHAILSFSDMGREKIETAPKEKLLGYYSRIHESGERLLGLLNDLLDLSKLEAGRMEFELQNYDVKKAVELVKSELAELLKSKSLTLAIESPAVDTTANFDHDKIVQVLRNLLSNAIKFTPEGKEIAISFGEQSLPEDESLTALSITVSDRGIGIPDDELESVFDKFVQSTKTRTGAGGTGLGLAICKEIIEGHGGTIWAVNNPDDGAAFSFTLPRHPIGE